MILRCASVKLLLLILLDVGHASLLSALGFGTVDRNSNAMNDGTRSSPHSSTFRLYQYVPEQTTITWNTAVDPATGNTYWYDPLTRETSWNPPKAPQPQQQHFGAGSRKLNPDAGRVINKADQHMAMVQQDSSTRTMARHSGDIKVSSAVFTDPRIETIREMDMENPYIDKSKELVEYSVTPSIIQLHNQSDEGEVSERAARGSNYKELLAQMKNQKRGGDGPKPTPMTPGLGTSAAQAPVVTSITGVAESDQFVADLKAAGLSLCHGILHASGCRTLGDLAMLDANDLKAMGADAFDHPAILRAVANLDNNGQEEGSGYATTRSNICNISTQVSGAFDKKKRGRFEEETQQDFFLEAICKDNNIFKGTLFTPEQCNQLMRMSEYHAYKGIGSNWAGWTNEIYTLTAQHMACRDVPGFLPSTDGIFRQLLKDLYTLYPGQLRQGSIRFETAGEPHLVKYNGKAKGTVLHTDNDDEVAFKSITINALLSPDDDFDGGGTYITAIDRTVKLKQGEMLIHLGDLEHAGTEITSGVRRLLVAFLACDWEPGTGANTNTLVNETT